MLNLVKDKGIDLVDVSTGGVVPAVPNAVKGYQIPHGEKIKKLTGLPVIAGSLVTDPQEAEEIIFSGKADFVYIGRELLEIRTGPFRRQTSWAWIWPGRSSMNGQSRGINSGEKRRNSYWNSGINTEKSFGPP